MIRNRKSRADAMILRAYVAGVLEQHSHLEPLTDKDIRRKLNNGASLTAIARARRWVMAAYRRDRLASLYTWIRLARQGQPPD